MIYRRGQVWWIKFYDNGRPRYESSGSRKETDAKRLLSLRLGQVVEGKCPAPEVQRITFEDLARDLETEYRANGRRSLGHLVVRIAHLRRFFCSMRATSITTSEVQKYIVKRQSEGASNATINRDLAALTRMFSLALQAEKMRHKPRVPHLVENNVRQGFFEYEDFEKVRDALQEHLRPLVTFAYHTGWRKSEIINLRWDQVDLHTATVRLEPGTTKNKQARMIFLGRGASGRDPAATGGQRPALSRLPLGVLLRGEADQVLSPVLEHGLP
ncbi:MAG: site-specific integrase [candidate division NC10 bacterium]|nr:site-specific integrase [candidate division NC10 bacterium]